MTYAFTLMLAIGQQAATPQVPDPTSVGWWLQTFGPIGVVAFIAGGGVWKLCMFLKPYVVALCEGHVALMSALSKTQVDQTSTLLEVKQIQEEHGEKLGEIHRHVVPVHSREQ